VIPTTSFQLIPLPSAPRMTRLWRVMLLLSLSLPLANAWAEIEIDISPDPAVVNESCRMRFRVIGGASGEPNFAELEKDFEILGRNQQTSINWINGRSQRTSTWALEVIPRRSGTLEIPAIAFGQEMSSARTLSVNEQSSSAQTAQPDILLRVDATPESPYVQQQLIFTIRLLHRVELSSPRFSSLSTNLDAVIKPLGDGRQYTEKLNGLSYDAYEQRYAIFPQESGLLRIDPIVLTTQIVRGRRSFFDPFSQNVQTRRIQSRAVEVDIRPVPETYPRDVAWLPARSVKLHEEWEPDSASLESGTPLARTVFLWADGLISGQLPEVAPEFPAELKAYPDQAQTNEQATASGFTAVRQQKFALLSDAGGKRRFPALSVPWWNVATDSLESALLPERTVDFILPAQPGEGAAEPGGTDQSSPSQTFEQPADIKNPAPRALDWRLVSGLLLALWLFTLLLWGGSYLRRLSARRAAPTESPRALSVSASTKQLLRACRENQPRAAVDALLVWSSAALPTTRSSHAPSLTEVARQTAGSPLSAAIHDLEAVLYGNSRTEWDGGDLAAAVSQHSSAPATAESAPGGSLPPLFKFVDN